MRAIRVPLSPTAKPTRRLSEGSASAAQSAQAPARITAVSAKFSHDTIAAGAARIGRALKRMSQTTSQPTSSRAASADIRFQTRPSPAASETTAQA